jgi:hypothetical protein
MPPAAVSVLVDAWVWSMNLPSLLGFTTMGADINASFSLLIAACASGGGGATVLYIVEALVILFSGSAVWENLGMSDLK